MVGDHQRAIEDYSEAIRLDPHSGGTYANRAQAYTVLGMDTEARRDIEQAVDLGIDGTMLEDAIDELKGRRS